MFSLFAGFFFIQLYWRCKPKEYLYHLHITITLSASRLVRDRVYVPTRMEWTILTILVHPFRGHIVCQLIKSTAFDWSVHPSIEMLTRSGSRSQVTPRDRSVPVRVINDISSPSFFSRNWLENRLWIICVHALNSSWPMARYFVLTSLSSRRTARMCGGLVPSRQPTRFFNSLSVGRNWIKLEISFSDTNSYYKKQIN